MKQQRMCGDGIEQVHWGTWTRFGGESEGEMSISVTENSAGFVKGEGK